ncbi:MAG: GAF domain-containing protein [Anaerolineales bacterium]|nr:GAF domain-containing protein [Anaerolineales bacterium]
MMQENNVNNHPIDRQKQERNAFSISVITAGLLTLSLIAALVFSRSSSLDIISLAGLIASILGALISAWLSRRNKSELGIGLLISILILVAASRVFITKGQAVSTGITNIIIVSGIAFYTLSRRWAGVAIMVSSLVTAATIIIDQYTVGVPTSSSPQTANIIAAILGVVYLVVIATQFRDFPLRIKLIFGFLLLTTLPLIILGWQSYTTTRNILSDQIKEKILESSLATSDVFQEFTNSQHKISGEIARTPEVIEYLSLPPAERTGSQAEAVATETLNALKDKSPTNIRSYALVSQNGINLLDTNPANVGVNFSTQPFFSYVVANNKPYASGLTLTNDRNDQVIYFASPITSKSNEMLGMVVVTYNAKILQAVMDAMLRARPTVAIDEYTYLIDETNFFILAHSTSLTLDYKTYLNTDDPRLMSLQAQGLLSPEDLQSISIPQPEIVERLSNIDNISAFQAPSAENDNETAETSAIRISNSNWIVVTGQPISTISNITLDQTRNAVLISVIITFLAAFSAVVISNIFTNPLLQLTRVAENISAGDFTQKAVVNTRDEIGTLANTVNKMSSQIRDLVSGLEQRVEQRTRELEQRTTDLEKITKQSEKRASELQTIAEISGYISAEKDLEKLLTLITQTVSERFGFYHVGIFLLNENRNFAVLRAANSPGGQVMLRRQHKLEVGQVGIVGNVTATGIPRIALDTGADAAFFNNPDLPETHSEMALPLNARGAIIGALDVQSTVPNAFTQTDVSILGLLADQIAIAIDNVRLLEETRNALAESQSVFRDYLAGAWQSKSASEIFGYYQTLTGGQLVTGNKAAEVDVKTQDGENTLAIPIQLRDQVIGTVHIRPSKEDRTWSKDEINIVNAVAERLGLALDNARLFEETSSRASRERLVTDITTKIRGTNDPQEMIKTAVQELQRVLGASRVEIVPRKNAPPPDK